MYGEKTGRWAWWGAGGGGNRSDWRCKLNVLTADASLLYLLLSATSSVSKPSFLRVAKMMMTIAPRSFLYADPLQ